jgi:hypothetical protein
LFTLKKKAIDLIAIETEIVFGGNQAVDPPQSLVDNIMSSLKGSLGFAAAVTSSGI